MPHIVLDRKIDLHEFSKHFSIIFQKSPLIKITRIYIEKNGLTALLSVVVIDNSHKEIFIEISTTRSKTTIRLHPRTDPEKTDNVKISLVLVCRQIVSCYPNTKFLKSNLWDYIQMGILN